jgi:signal transduction histidine kinase
MRRRLLASTLAAVGVAVFLLGLPLSVAVKSLLQADALDRLQRDAETTLSILAREGGTPLAAAPVLEFISTQTGTEYTILDAAGRVLADTGGLPVGQTLETADVGHAVRNGSPGRMARGNTISVTVPATLGGLPLLLRASEPAQEFVAQVRRAWIAIGSLGLTALGAGALLAMYQGQQIASPLEDLADAARRLGEGDFSVQAPRSGLPEADDVAAALDTTAMRLGAMLERSRSFSADASHQLRTPLTALRLDIEALEATGADAELVAAAMAETDRLEATIDELLTLTEPREDATLVDLGQLAADRLEAWQALARAQGRDVVLDAGPVAGVRARAAALGQTLQVLLDNALEHGDGTITITVRHVPGPGVRLCVADEGPGFPPGDLPQSADREGSRRGRGLPLARSLIEAEGGRLMVERPPRGALVCLLMPAEGRTAPVPPAADAVVIR